ncbi:NADH-quinone oxidoreductase subunit L [Fontisubflavum oceani]|uniref:NADH-quinone oxidoreductase subunit L n=1 Tax=Fontisubflavum oceani TaxID=2978973 RepID=UPI0025B607AE|nr:NADH-quinone oxidoreductase subunit L [Fontisubflavum oceani]WJY21716.1 NADH-quinone oxidoreductase subunit L [Fontisubflavum oceani]
MTFLAYLAPLALIAAAIVAFAGPGMRPARSLALINAASLLALVIAAAIAVTVMLQGPTSSALIGANGLGLQIRLDALSAVMMALVSFIGWVVLRYARNYMDGDARQGAFSGGLALTLGAVMLLVMSGNVLQLVLAWMLTSLSLHRLLTFYGERPIARLAARKKFLFARIGDVFLISAAVILFQSFGTGEIATITAQLQTGEIPGGLTWAAIFLAITALLKSAQFPTHGWLTEVMDAPTPVSALLHAGVINAGGFLVIRFADLFLVAGPAMHLLAIVGGLTAALASLVMLAQTSIKVSLAWSTVAQMGFMLLQCGLGAFSTALLHIVAHSLYKAHAFLGSGSVVDQARAKLGHRLALPKLSDMGLALGVAALTVLGTGWAFGVTLESKPALVVLGAILVFGLAHLMALALGQQARGALVAKAALASVMLSTLYFGLQLGTEALVASAVPVTGAVSFGTALLMGLMLAVFALTAWIQLAAPRAVASGRWQAFAVHLRNGFYATTTLNRALAPSLKA